MFIFFVGSTMFVMGIVAGYMVCTRAYDGQDWQLLRWSYDSSGYRPVPIGNRLMRNDKIIMALFMNTDEFPDGGLEYTEDE